MKLYLEYHEGRSGGEICEGQENDSWPSHEDEEIDFSIVAVRLERGEHWLVEEIKTDFDVKVGDAIHVIVARYYDGDTFGRTCGMWKICEVCKTAEEADAIEEKLRHADNSDGKYSWPWFGYFSGLEDIQTHRVKVKA